MGYSSGLDSEIRKIAPEVRQVANQEAELNDLSTRLRAFTATLQTRDRNLEALRELARILPPTAFLSNYSYQDGSITVSGFATSASEIQNLLESSPMFKNAEFSNSVTRDADKDRFTVKLAFEVSR
jgi:Tfp pilus assembly protein PilN